jgi:DNA-binding NarL/FixJ family response regulator
VLRLVDLQSRHVRVTQLGADLICISVDASTAPPSSADKLAALTSSERAVAELAARGVSNRRIAELRETSLRTVANQLTSAYKKLGLTSRRELSVLLSAGPG